MHCFILHGPCMHSSFSSLTKDSKKQVLSYYTGHLVGDRRGEEEIGWRKVKGYEREWEESERNILMGGGGEEGWKWVCVGH